MVSLRIFIKFWGECFWESKFVFLQTSSSLLNHFVVLCIHLLCCMAFIYCHQWCSVGFACFIHLFVCCCLHVLCTVQNANYQVMPRSMHACDVISQDNSWTDFPSQYFWTPFCNQKQTTDYRIKACTGRKKLFCWRKSKGNVFFVYHHSWFNTIKMKGEREGEKWERERERERQREKERKESERTNNFQDARASSLVFAGEGSWSSQAHQRWPQQEYWQMVSQPLYCQVKQHALLDG